MDWLNNLRIWKKIFLAFGVLIFLMIILTVFSASQFIGVNKTFSNLATFTSRRHTDLTNALETLALLRINNISTAYQISDDEISQSLFILSPPGYETMCTIFLKHIGDYREHVTSDTSLSAQIGRAHV